MPELQGPGPEETSSKLPETVEAQKSPETAGWVSVTGREVVDAVNNLAEQSRVEVGGVVSFKFMELLDRFEKLTDNPEQRKRLELVAAALWLTQPGLDPLMEDKLLSQLTLVLSNPEGSI